MALPKWYKRLSGRSRLEGKRDLKRTREISKLKHLYDIATNYVQQINNIGEKVNKRDLSPGQAGKLERKLFSYLKKDFKEALAYSLLFMFVALGVYSAVYLRDSITGFAVFTNNNPSFDFASLIFIGILVFVLYLYLHRED